MSTQYLSYSQSALKRMALRCVVLLASLLCFSLHMNAWADGVSQVDALHVRSNESGVYIDAQMTLNLSPVMQEALDKGVGLYFLATADITHKRWYWFDAVDAHETKVVRLGYQPLLRQYRVTVGGLNQSFSTLSEALNLLGNIAGWRIADAKVLGASEHQELIFTFELDHTRLPRLFQVGAGKDKGWRLFLRQEVSLAASSSGE